MSRNEEREDERLSRLLATVRADAEPALWTRVRARIEATERVPRWEAWLMRPAALGASLALLVVAVAAAVVLMSETPRAAGTAASEDLGDALVAELDQSFTETVAPGLAVPSLDARAPRDSGGIR